MPGVSCRPPPGLGVLTGEAGGMQSRGKPGPSWGTLASLPPQLIKVLPQGVGKGRFLLLLKSKGSALASQETLMRAGYRSSGSNAYQIRVSKKLWHNNSPISHHLNGYAGFTG